MEKHPTKLIALLTLGLCLVFAPGLVFGQTSLTNSGDLANLSLFDWIEGLERASGAKIVLAITNPANQALRLPANWRSGRSLERSLQDLIRLWPELSWEKEKGVYRVSESTNQGFGSGSLVEHLFAITKTQGIAGGIALFGRDSLLEVRAPLGKAIDLDLERHLENLRRFYGFLDYQLSDEALTLQLFDDNSLFSKEVDNPDGSPLTKSAWSQNTLYFAVSAYLQVPTSFSALELGNHSFSEIMFSPSLAAEVGWFLIDDLFLSAAIKTAHFEAYNTHNSGLLLHFSLGAHYMFDLLVFRFSLGLELMIDEYLSKEITLLAEGEPIETLVHPAILGRLWIDFLDPIFVFADIGLGPNYVAFSAGLGFKI